ANGEYTINGATVTADANGKLAIDSGWLGQLLLSIVKKGNGTTTSDSASQALNVPTRPATPTGVGATNETYPSAGDGTLTGVNPALEYKQGTAGAWTSIAGVAVTGLGPDTYYVRTKATATAFASAEAAVTVAAGMTPLTYTIAPIGNETLAALMQGYAPGSQEMKTLTITRTGTGDLTNVRVELGGANAADFELTQPGTTTLNGSIPATTFTVRAKDGLTAGVYTATVTVKANLMADVTFTVSQVVIPPVPSNSTLDVTTVAFDRNTANTNAGHYADAAVNLTLNGNELRGLLLNGTTVTSSVYSLDHTGKLTIYKEFLATLEPGPQVFTLDMSGGIDPTLTVIVTDSTPGNSTVDSVTATFDRNTSNTNAGHYADVEVNLQLNGNTLLGLMLNGNTVTSSVYALDAAGKLTIYKEFLLTLEPGTQVFTLDMSGGVDPTLTVTINDSTPQNSTLDVTAGTFDRNTSNTSAGHYADITVSLTLNGNTLLGVLLNGAGIGGESYSLDGSGKLTIKKEFLAKLGKGSHTFTLDMSAGADPTFTVTVTDSTPAEDPQDTSTSGQPSSGGVSPAPQISVDVYVNGKAESAGTAELEQVNGQSVTTIKVDPQKLEAKLEAEGPGALVTVVIGQESDVVVGSLNGEMIGKMERKQGVLRLQTPGASYSIPASEINIEALAERLGAASKLQDVEVQIRIAEPGAEKSAQVRKSAADEGFTVIAPPLDFVITVRSNDETIELKDFNLYVERTIGLPEGVDPSRITTGIVIENDGSVRHVPTQVIKSDGKYYAKINSLTNSTYSVIWHPVEFADVAEHWGRTAVNDMGSRMVVEGVGDHLFQPDKNITRAEFASILARGLGLRVAAGAAAASYEDVKPGDWFSGAVIAASKLRLIAGYEDGTFRPQEKITRQEVMTMLARAMAVTGLKEKLSQPAALIEGYEDQADIADWAVDSVRASVQAGIVSGRSGTLLAPQAYMTKAEVAAVMQRLLRKSELID
ncbi:X2-like carbohydrate binding domain-containing protein, partial [Paenibacillus sp. cl123]|uniref:X2-like carbohydrate binding domain-containing protein n=1 Tax=Paenibacillus sp. cl123 TaxID=1761875 RepID=UPI000883EA3F